MKKTIEREHDMLSKGQKLKSRVNKLKEMEKQLKENEILYHLLVMNQDY